MESERAYASIADVYRNLTILITGGTGFLGKVLVEKLLRSCPELKRIYLIVREKKGQSVQERLDNIFKDPLFSILETQQPEYRRKITGILGDFSSKGLNINLNDSNKLITEVDVIFHGAAIVRFDADIKYLYNINIRGTKEFIELATKMLHLKAFVYISTAYSNCPRKDISETLYPPPMSVQDVTDMIENTNDDVLNIMERKIIQDWPNAYTLTKAIAESLFKNFGNRLPTVIFRPSIVLGTAYEPILGWIDNMNGPVGISIGVGKGVVHVTLIDGQKPVDIIPVDMCVSALIASSWEMICNSNRDTNSKKEECTVETQRNIQHCEPEPIIYNYVSSSQNALLWHDYAYILYQHITVAPLSNLMWHPFYFSTKHWPIYILLVSIFQHLPALLIDNIAKLFGRKLPNLGRIYKKVNNAFESVQCFTTRSWNFNDKNVQKLWICLNSSDQQIFKFNIGELDWLTYLKNQNSGARQYLFKEDHTTIPAAKLHLKRLYWIHQATKALLLYLAYRIILLSVKSVFGFI